MKIGTVLELEVPVGNYKKTRTYRSNIIEMTDTHFFMDYPVEKHSKKTGFFYPGDSMHVSYKGHDQSIYSFNTMIIKRMTLGVPALMFKLPGKSDIKRTQRRKYVRVNTAVDTAFHHPQKEKSPFTTVTADISGGGMSVILPKNARLVPNDHVLAWIVLPMKSGTYHYIVALMETIRIKSNENSIKTASLKFNSITSQNRQKIIQYCFEKQREARKKELD